MYKSAPPVSMVSEVLSATSTFCASTDTRAQLQNGRSRRAHMKAENTVREDKICEITSIFLVYVGNRNYTGIFLNLYIPREYDCGILEGHSADADWEC